MRSDPRAVALDALVRIERGAFANLVLPAVLQASRLDGRDRALVTELVYGTTRMRRACDWLVGSHLRHRVEPTVRQVLRLGAYQLRFTDIPAHAAVAATVTVAPRPARGLVNAVLREVARSGERPWPDLPTALSYPDWVLERLSADLGHSTAVGALSQMNLAPRVAVREDGYVQDEASQHVAMSLGARPGDTVGDLCAAPGGKTTAIASSQPSCLVLGMDIRPSRIRLVRSNSERLGLANIAPVVADARRAPARPGSLDRVLVDAPCSGLGSLQRRPDARWRIDRASPTRLSALQRSLLDAGRELLRPGGTLVYSVCTMTSEETSGIDRWLRLRHPDMVAEPALAGWRRHGRGSLLLPQDAGTDGMFVLKLRLHPNPT